MNVRRCVCVVLVGCLCLMPFMDGRASAGSPRQGDVHLHDLTVQTQPSGGVRATATLLFPGKPEVIEAILADYPKWPELFETRMRIAHLEQRDGRVLTELFISHALLPGERRLLCESHTLPGGGLVTDLKGGDFKQYHRVWKLQPAGDGTQTRAEFDLLVEVDTVVPDWLIGIAMERELETHFRIVRERALDRLTKGK